jgi:ribosomal protein S18 acetylase RimI-like enzyme
MAFYCWLLNCFMVRLARNSDIPDLARVHVQSWLETYSGLLPMEVVNSFSLEARQAQWQRTLASSSMVVFVAESHGAVVGFCSLAWRENEAELFTIYVLKSFQGLGFGLGLWNAAIEAAKAKQRLSLVLWVLEGNPSCGFYQHLGGRLEGRKVEMVNHIALTEVSYRFAL